MSNKITERQAGPLVEVTPKMIEAGVHELRDHPFTAPLQEIVEAVYMAMEYERLDSPGKIGRLSD